MHWVSTYGYPGFIGLLVLAAAGVPLPIELVLVALGALSATSGGPSFIALAALGIAATGIGDILDYALGRALGQTALNRWLERWVRPSPKDTVADEEPLRSSWMQRLAAWSGSGPMILLTRCALTQLEMPVSLLAGALRQPFYRFLVWDLLGEALYILGYMMLGRLGGAMAASGPLLFIYCGLVVCITCCPLLLVQLVKRQRTQPTPSEVLETMSVPASPVARAEGECTTARA